VSGLNECAVDLGLVKTGIRQAAARQRRHAAEWVAGLASGAGSFNLLQVKGRLRRAAGLAQSGTSPRLVQLHGWKRRLALLLSWTVQRLGLFLTTRQTHCNRNFLEILRNSAQAVYELENLLLQQQEQIHRLEAFLEEGTLDADHPGPTAGIHVTESDPGR
jgi:hypothetical protein